MLIRENNIEDFKFINVVNTMCEVSIEKRYQSFKDVSDDIAKGVLLGTDFSARDKAVYQDMASSLVNTISYYTSDFSPVSEVERVQVNLGELIRNSSLEEYIQANSALISCFLTNGFTYSLRIMTKVDTVKDFYRLLIDSDYQKKEIILENLIIRLSLIEIKKPNFDIDDDELPF